MEKFCETLDTRYLTALSNTDAKKARLTLGKINPNMVDDEYEHIYYILYSFYYPLKMKDIRDIIPQLNKISRNRNLADFCKYLASLKNVLTKSEINRLLGTVYVSVVAQGLNPSLNNTDKTFLDKLFKIVDDVYFDGYLEKSLKKHNAKLKFLLDEKNKKGVAGWCDLRGCVHTINIHLSMFTDIFKPKKGMVPEYVYNSGLQCYNPLECLIYTFLHELTHFITDFFCVRHAGHTRVFKDIVRNLFGQTKIYHYFDVDYGKAGFTKEEALKKKIFYVDYKGVKYIGVIVNHSANTARLALYDSKGDYIGADIKVPYERLLKEKVKVPKKLQKEPNPKNRVNRGDKVKFIYKNKTHVGVIMRKNPSRAKVKIKDGMIFNVPYGALFK